MMLDYLPIYPDDGGDRFIWNIATYLSNNIAGLSRCKYDDIGISTLILYFISLASTMPVPVAMQSNVWDYGHLLAGIVGSNPAGGMDICLLWVLCVEVSVMGWSHVQRSPTEFGVSECDWGTS